MTAHSLLSPATPRRSSPLLPPLLLLLLTLSFSDKTALAQLPYDEGLDGIPVLIEKSHKWGMLSPKDGSLLFDGYFDASDELSESYNGIFTVTQGEKVYIYKLGKTPVKLTETAFSSAGANSFDNVLPVVRRGQTIQFVDTSTGKIRSSKDGRYDGHKIVLIDERFSYGAAAFRDDNHRCGLINQSGKVVSNVTYTHLINSPYDIAAGLNEEEGVWELFTPEGYVLTNIHYNKASDEVPLFGEDFIFYDFSTLTADGSSVLSYFDPDNYRYGISWNDNLLIGLNTQSWQYAVWDKYGKLQLPFFSPGMPVFDFDTGMYYYITLEGFVEGFEIATGENRFKVQGDDFILLKDGMILVDNTKFWTLYGRKNSKPMIFEKVSNRLSTVTIGRMIFDTKQGAIYTEDFEENGGGIGLGIAEEGENTPLKDALVYLIQGPYGTAPLTSVMNEDPDTAFGYLKGLTDKRQGNKYKNYFRLPWIDELLEKEQVCLYGYHFSGGVAFKQPIQTSEGTPNNDTKVYFCSLSVEPLPDNSPEELLRVREEILDFFTNTLGFREDEEYFNQLRQGDIHSELGTAFKRPVYLRSNLRYSYDVILPGEKEISSGDASSVSFEMISHDFLENGW